MAALKCIVNFMLWCTLHSLFVNVYPMFVYHQLLPACLLLLAISSRTPTAKITTGAATTLRDHFTRCRWASCHMSRAYNCSSLSSPKRNTSFVECVFRFHMRRTTTLYPPVPGCSKHPMLGQNNCSIGLCSLFIETCLPRAPSTVAINADARWQGHAMGRNVCF